MEPRSSGRSPSWKLGIVRREMYKTWRLFPDAVDVLALTGCGKDRVRDYIHAWMETFGLVIDRLESAMLDMGILSLEQAQEYNASWDEEGYDPFEGVPTECPNRSLLKKQDEKGW